MCAILGFVCKVLKKKRQSFENVCKYLKKKNDNNNNNNNNKNKSAGPTDDQ